jgi:hypothetical protein
VHVNDTPAASSYGGPKESTTEEEIQMKAFKIAGAVLVSNGALAFGVANAQAANHRALPVRATSNEAYFTRSHRSLKQTSQVPLARPGLLVYT